MIKKIFLFLLLIVLFVVAVATMMFFGISLITAVIITASVLVGLICLILLRKLVLYLIIVSKRDSDASVIEGDTEPQSFYQGCKRVLANLLGIRKDTVSIYLSKLLRLIYNKNYPVAAYNNPWYLLLGETGSGKSSLLRFANLSLLPDQDEKSIENDQDINFWFTDSATFIDVPGDILVSVDHTKKKHSSRWYDLLFSLLRYRIVEPLNGVIVTVSVADLLHKSSQDLELSGAFNRKRINDILQVFRAPICVYLVLTHLDSIDGVTDCCVASKDKLDNQTIGLQHNQKASKVFVLEALEKAIASVKWLLLSALGKLHINSRLLKLPAEMQDLKPSLQSFVRGLFSGTFYKYTPKLQGVYMTGVLDVEGSSQGIFSHEMMRYKIPASRPSTASFNYIERLYVLLKLFFYTRWKNAVLIVLVLFMLTTGYGVSNLVQYVNSYQKQEVIVGDAASIEKHREVVNNIYNTVYAPYIPWFRWYVDADFIAEVQTNYYQNFYASFIDPTDRYYADNIDKLIGTYVYNSAYSKKEMLGISEYAVHLISRIAILTHLEQQPGITIDALSELPDAFYAVSTMYNEYANADMELLNKQYLYAVYWSNREEIVDKIKAFKKQLTKLLVFLTLDYSWLLKVTNHLIDVERFKLPNYWAGSKTVINEYFVKGSYTLSGKGFIDTIIAKMDFIFSDTPYTTEKELFLAQYRKQYLTSWREFAMNFSNGISTLKNRSEWIMELSRLGLATNPYFQAIAELKEQLSPFIEDNQDVPLWVEMLSYYEYIMLLNNKEVLGKDKKSQSFMKYILGMIGGSELGQKLASSMQETAREQYHMFKKMGKTDAEISADLKVATKELKIYIDALKDISFNIGIKSVSYETMQDMFKNADDIGAGTSVLAKAYSAIRSLKFLTGSSTSESKPFWHLYQGALELVQQFMLFDTACVINEKWDSQFIAEADGVAAEKLSGFMFGSSGLLWKFVDNYMADFIIARRGIGYKIKRVGNKTLQVKTDFLRFLVYGRSKSKKKEQKIDVVIKASPTNVNLGAMYFPEKTIISLQCPKKTQTIENYNYNSKHTFKWNSKCSDLSVSIYISDLILQKTYTGTEALYKFMKAFKSGNLRFSPKDFPAQEDELRFMDIKTIDLSYKFTGKHALKKALRVAPSNPPKQVAVCWK
jgi:type VI secretion system protein ImpL